MCILTLSASETSTNNNIFQFIVIAFIFVIVLVLTGLTTKWIASYNKLQGYQRNIETIETYRITNNKWIQILKIGQRYIVVAIGKDEVNFLLELKEDDIVKFKNTEGSNFNNILDKILLKNKITEQMKEEFDDE